MRGMAAFYRAERDKLEEEGKLTERDGLKISLTDAQREGWYLVVIWHGNRAKATSRYIYPTIEKACESIEMACEGSRKSVAFKADCKAAEKAKVDEMKAKIKVGSIMHYSWGYDQTQCDYFEVVERTAGTVMLREIGAETVPGSEGFMSDRRKPVPGTYYGKPFKKRITSYGVSFAHGCGSLVSADYVGYCSWYA